MRCVVKTIRNEPAFYGDFDECQDYCERTFGKTRFYVHPWPAPFTEVFSDGKYVAQIYALGC